MKSLNSILIEGILTDDPVLITPPTDDLAPARCTFSISSDPDLAQVPIVTYHRIAVYCAKNLSQGSTIRVVGRIAQDTDASTSSGSFRLLVVAEHVELKPSASRKLPTEETADVGF